ncbi:MAG: HAMP domain-containing protein [Myxococcota bacterium]
MRVPLAVKVMLSYVAVIATGAVPVHLSLRHVFQARSTEQLGVDLQQRGRRVADRLSAAPSEDLVRVAMEAAALLPENVTLLSLDGTILFDNELPVGAARENQRTQPEVVAALQEGAALAMRESRHTGERTVYAAAAVQGPKGPRAVLRLAAPTRPVEAATRLATKAVEYGGALALSAALLLSFVAVLRLVRPLRRMRDAANALATGELAVQVDVDSQDELGDLARALEAVGGQLRTRFATAGSGDALMGQLVHAMYQGVVVMEANGQVTHINGVARTRLGLRGPQESERVARLISSHAVREATAQCVSDPLGVDMRVPHPVTGEPVDGTVVALRRHHGDPLFALILDVTADTGVPTQDVPDAADVVAVPFREVMDRALSSVREDLEESNATFQTPDEWPAANVADVGHRVLDTVVETLKAAARAPGAQPNTPLSASIQNGSVCLNLPVTLPISVVERLAPRLAPLGGKVQVGGGGVQLWLPRA